MKRSRWTLALGLATTALLLTAGSITAPVYAQVSMTDPDAGGNDIRETVGQSVAMMLPYIAKRRAEGADGSLPMIDGLIQEPAS